MSQGVNMNHKVLLVDDDPLIAEDFKRSTVHRRKSRHFQNESIIII
jgi:hypothetical protein